MPVLNKHAVWEGEGRSLQQLVSFCYDLWIENKSCLKKFFSENEISAVFKTDTDLCEIARSAHFTAVESIGKYKILKSSSKGSTALQHVAMSEEINRTKKLKIDLLKSADDKTKFNIELDGGTCHTVFITPCKKGNTKRVLQTALRESIVKKLEQEFIEGVYTQDDVDEAKVKLEKAQKVDMLGASLGGVNVLKNEIEDLTLLFNKSFKEFVYCYHKKSVPPTIDWDEALTDSEGILERVAHSLFGSLCNLRLTQKVSTLHALTASMKHSLKEYIWFLSIFKDAGEVEASKVSLQSVLACTLSDMFKSDSNLAHLTLLPQSDPRVARGAISQFDFYVEAANLVSRPAAPATGGDSLKKVNFVAGIGNSAGGAEEESPQGKESDREKIILKDIVLALGKLEKDPQGVCMKEIKTELHSTEVKSLFERIEKGAEKSKDKKKRASRDSSSDSDSSSSESSDSSRKSRGGRPGPKKKVVVDEKEKREKKGGDKAPAQRKRKAPIVVDDDSNKEILHAITRLGNTLNNTLARDRNAREDLQQRQGQRGAQGREGGYDRPAYRDNYRRFEEPRRDGYGNQGRDGRDQHREGGGGRFTRATGGLGAPSFPPKTKKGEICDKLFETGKCPDVECRAKHGKCDLRTEKKCNNERDGKCCDWLLTARGCTFRHDECAPYTKNARRV